MRLIKMEIMPTEQMIPAAINAVSALAQGIFQDKRDVEKTALALEEAIANITQYCVTDSLESIAIEAETNEHAFILTVTDKGMPGDLEKMLKGENSLGLSLMNHMMDSVTIENLGQGGRRQRLIKNLTRMPVFEKRVATAKREASEDIHITIRPVGENETEEVARCIYDEFGFTYVYPTVYYPEQFYAATKNGSVYSLVAVTDEGEIAAHLALSRRDEMPGIWEMGMAVVKRPFRKAHIMDKLTNAIVDYAQNGLKLNCMLAEPVFYHPYTQKLALKNGFSSCGAALLHAPSEMQITMGNEQQRRSVGIAFRLFKRDKRTLYISEEIRPFMEEMLKNMELERELILKQSEPEQLHSESIANEYKALRLGSIIFDHIGKDFAAQLKANTTHLKRCGVEVMEMYFKLTEPGAQLAYEAAKAQGYFMTGFIPAGDTGDYMLMQNLFSYAADYENFITIEPFTSTISFIRSLDPDDTKEGETQK